MQVPMTEIELIILDQLADGGLPLGALVRELREGKRAWDAGLIVTGLSRLVERALLHYCRTPGGPIYTSPAPELIHAQVVGLINRTPQDWYLELTDDGQVAWEQWQQSRHSS
ncbi:MAG TPA: hypothetical protein PK794_13285 [Armatimonadota bacterium]|nr:hypothetical protein [Armatimonadota bacterium]